MGMMRERIIGSSEDKFEKHKANIAKGIGKKDKTMKERSLRLWSEIITGRKYFNMQQIAHDAAKTIQKQDVLRLFDDMVSTKLSKLSVQEFSKKADSIPKDTPKIRGYQSKLIKGNYFRKNKKFVQNVSH